MPTRCPLCAVCCVACRVNNLQYAADAAAAILPAYEAALGVRFPLPKLDLVVRLGGGSWAGQLARLAAR